MCWLMRVGRQVLGLINVEKESEQGRSTLATAVKAHLCIRMLATLLFIEAYRFLNRSIYIRSFFGREREMQKDRRSFVT